MVDPPSAEQLVFDHIQELGIAVVTLTSAMHEMQASRRVGTGDSARGPFPEKYLEGLEQANEARRIALGLGLQEVTAPLTQLPTLGQGVHNALVAEAVPQLAGVRGALEKQLRDLREMVPRVG